MATPTLLVRIAHDSAPFAAVPSWTDYPTALMLFSIRRGRQHELDRMEAGTSTIVLLNTSGLLWPNVTATIKPCQRINIRATYNAITYDLYTGFIESWQPDFILRPIKGAVMVLTCTDLIGAFASLNLNSAGYAEELSGTRVHNVINDLAWLGAHDLDAGQSSVIATGALVNENAMSHLGDVQLAEQGIVFVQGDGDVEFQDRHARLKAPYLVSNGIFGDDAGELGYHAIEFAYDNTYIYNDVRMTREGGAEQTASDATSQLAYGKRTLSRTGLQLVSNAEALSQAQYLLSQYKDPAMRVRAIIIRPGVSEASLYPLVLGLDISARITVRLNQAVIDEDYHIEGISHDFDASTQMWETKWELSPASTEIYWVWDSAKWDTTTKWAW